MKSVLKPVCSDTIKILYEPAQAWLAGAAGNETSQFGEDGLIAACLKKFGEQYRTCFEVGAADGIYCSNTWRLREAGWSAVLIENNKVTFERLKVFHNDKV